MAQARAILITGATGKQGGSLVDALLKRNTSFEILALTRDTQSTSSQKLLQKSPKIKLVSGNLDTVDDVFRNAKAATKAQIWGVFSVQSRDDLKALGKNEEKQGISLVDASLKNGVRHFVYSSADRGGTAKSDTDPTNVPHFVTKFNIEQHLFAKAKGSDMSYTVLRPVAFFENLVPGFFGKVFTTSWAMRLRASQKLQLVATSDIGFFAAESFSKHEEAGFRNKSVSLAGDELTFEEFKEVFERKTGETLPTTYQFLTSVILWLLKELGYMFTWFQEVGFGADIQGLKKVNPGMKDFKTWLETESSWKSR
ncbi:Nn.00g022970.m01.CDS01 [Neocucurbitaria sp. VM-36]